MTTTMPLSGDGLTAPHDQPVKSMNANPVPIVDDGEPEFKRLARLKARAAQAGHTLLEVRDGYLLTKWGRVIHCTGLDTVDAALSRMGVKQ